MPASRPCNDCGTEYARTAEHWHKNPKRPDGLSNICKSCACTRTGEHYECNPDKRREYEQKRRAATTDERREYQKIYRTVKAEELREMTRRRYVANGAGIRA